MTVYTFTKTTTVPTGRIYVARKFSFDPSPGIYYNSGSTLISPYPYPEFWSVRFFIDSQLVPNVNDGTAPFALNGLGTKEPRDILFLARERQSIVMKISSVDVADGAFGSGDLTVVAELAILFDSLADNGAPLNYQIANLDKLAEKSERVKMMDTIRGVTS